MMPSNKHRYAHIHQVDYKKSIEYVNEAYKSSIFEILWRKEDNC